MEAQAKPLITEFSVPLRIDSSHNYNSIDFSSLRTCVLGSDTNSLSVELDDIVIAGFACSKLTLAPPNKEKYQILKVVFKNPVDPDDAISLVETVSTALTIELAKKQNDPWYGNFFVNVNWFSWHQNAFGGIMPTARMAVDLNHFHELNKEFLINAQPAEYSEIFIQGMKTGNLKAKCLYWFFIIEKLELLNPFKEDFTYLYTPDEIEAIESLAKTFKGRKKDRLIGFASNNPTEQIREQKLAYTLNKIGITEVDILDQGKMKIDEDFCEKIIKERNKAAHKHTSVDERILYQYLFPVSIKVLDYLNQSNK